jgi:class 3 adenylate cyclase
LRAGSTPEQVYRSRATVRTWDATALMPAIRVPALVITYPTGLLPEDDLARRAREMAGAIPGAQLLMLDDEDQAARAVHEFISGDEASPRRSAAELPEGTAIILFADIVDSTAITEQLGDAAFRTRASRLDAVMRSGIRDCGGTPIEGKVMGDGVMAVFGAARKAIDAAFRCRAAADGTGLALHLGIHAGDVTREGDNVYGGAVNIASRVCGLSAPNEILVSSTVRDLARTSAGAAFEDRGEQEMKGVGDPVRVYAVLAGDSP